MMKTDIRSDIERSIEDVKAATGDVKCKTCQSTNIIKYGKARGLKKQKQKYYCKSCLSFFSI